MSHSIQVILNLLDFAFVTNYAFQKMWNRVGKTTKVNLITVFNVLRINIGRQYVDKGLFEAKKTRNHFLLL